MSLSQIFICSSISLSTEWYQAPRPLFYRSKLRWRTAPTGLSASAARMRSIPAPWPMPREGQAGWRALGSSKSMQKCCFKHIERWGKWKNQLCFFFCSFNIILKMRGWMHWIKPAYGFICQALAPWHWGKVPSKMRLDVISDGNWWLCRKMVAAAATAVLDD